MSEILLLPVEDTEEWVEKYGLRIKTGNCHKCGVEIVTDIPFAFLGYRGLKSADHGCGDKFTWKTFKPVGEKEKAGWAEIAKKI